MHFWKYQGAGNDFILVDQRKKQDLTRSDVEKIAFLCDRHFGIGADGLILLQARMGFDFEMVYFNSDGKESTMCGNGGRCIAAFAKHLHIQSDRYRFWAIDGAHEATLPHPTRPGAEWVELKMGDVSRIETTGAPANPDYILNTGSPHFVRFVPDLDSPDFVQQGRAIRNAAPYSREGINVNFVRQTPEQLFIRTYERGVEDETLACGTGVTAAALAWFRHNHRPPGMAEISVKARGGDLLVRFQAHEDGSVTDIWLCGPAQRVFCGEINI